MTEQRTSSAGFHGAGFAKVAADGTFSMRSGAGTMQLGIVGLPPRWFVKSAQLDGVDVTDVSFDLTPGGRRRLDITLSDRVSRLSGTVTDRSARPVSNALVIVFPEERARWTNTALHPHDVLTPAGTLRDRCASDLQVSRRRSHVTAAQRRGPDPDVLARLWPLGIAGVARRSRTGHTAPAEWSRRRRIWFNESIVDSMIFDC